MTEKYPLAWPDGWPRAKHRKSGLFGKTEMVHREGADPYRVNKDLTMDEAVKRVAYELERLAVNVVDDSVISTNLRLNMSGRPRADQGEPGDPGVAIYFQKKGGPMRVIAIDAYHRVRDNIAAIAATLQAMRAIERHGGAQILERAFTGFDALPPPPDPFKILGITRSANEPSVQAAFRAKARTAHPDAGGSHNLMAELTAARDAALTIIRSQA